MKSDDNVERRMVKPPVEERVTADLHEQFLELAEYRMPFGKYKGRRLVDLPEPYVVWFSQQGFPPGRLGEMLRIVYDIKVNGLEYLFTRS